VLAVIDAQSGHEATMSDSHPEDGSSLLMSDINSAEKTVGYFS
jgi:hypothetical protein